jgi:hypothetical protein
MRMTLQETDEPEDTASLDVQRFFSDWAGAQFLSLMPGATQHGPGFYGGSAH